jgi:hypothetical protein
VWLEERCRALWAELIYPEAQALTIAAALAIERDALMPMVPMVPAFDRYVETVVSVLAVRSYAI